MIDGGEMHKTEGSVYYDKHQQAWFFNYCYIGTYRGNENDWWPWANRNCDQYNDIDFYRDGRMHCPKWIGELVKQEKLLSGWGEGMTLALARLTSQV